MAEENYETVVSINQPYDSNFQVLPSQQNLRQNTTHQIPAPFEQILTQQHASAKTKIILLIIVLVVSMILIAISATLLFFAYKMASAGEAIDQGENRNEGGKKFFQKIETIKLSGQRGQQIKNSLYYLEDGTEMVLRNFFREEQIQKLNFEQLQQRIQKNIAYQTFNFEYDSKLQQNYPKTQFLVPLSNYESAFKQETIRKLIQEKIKGNQKGADEKFYQLEYLIADKKYLISKETQELPICIFTEGLDISQQDMKRYLQSLQDLNYKNFHIVYINQFSSDLSTHDIFSYLKNSKMRIKNKIKIVNNMQDIGTLGSMYFWIKKFCHSDDIVFVLDKDEEIIGRQAFKMLNQVYQSQNIWYSSVSLIKKQQIKVPIFEGDSGNQKQNFFSKQGISAIRSFRRKLIDVIPLQCLMGYQYDGDKNEVWASFYKPDFSNFQLYFQFHKIEQSRKVNLSQLLILTHRRLDICQKQRAEHQNYIIKTLMPIKYNSLGQKAQIDLSYKINAQQFNKSKLTYQNLLRCKDQACIKIVSKRNRKIYKRTVDNPQYIKKPFGKSATSAINLTNYLPQTLDYWKSIRVGETKSKEEAIYVLTPTDLNKLVEKIDFWKYKEQLQGQIPYQILQFQFDHGLQKKLPQLPSLYFKRAQDKLQYLKKFIISEQTAHYDIGKLGLYLSKNQQFQEAYLQYINKRYKINEKQNQVPICIFTAQRNIFKRNQYRQYFESIQMLNYSNYHIIYVDDASTDDSAYEIYDLVNNKYQRIRNRMKIIHNLQAVGALGNLYFWSQKFCRQNDIVVNVDADDAILGTQTLKILSSIYENENIWYAYSNHLDYNPNLNYTNIGASSQPFFTPTTEYRRLQHYTTSHIRTFRLKLMKSVPLYQIIDFHYNTTTKIAWPTFQSLAYDTSQVHAHFQLAGNQRIRFIEDFLYTYYGSAGTRRCYNIHERFDELKNSVKTPLQKLQSLDEKGHQIKEKRIAEYLYQQPAFYNKYLIDGKCYLG